MIELITHLRYLLTNSRRVSSLPNKRQLHSFVQQCRSVPLLSSDSEKRFFLSKMNLHSPVQGEYRAPGHLVGNLNSLTMVRNFGLYRKIFKKKTPDKYRERDDVASHYDLVYEGKSSSYALWGFGFVEGVTLSCCCVSALSLLSTWSVVQKTHHLISMEPIEFAIFFVINAALCVFLAITCKMYALRIYYSELEDDFIIVFIGRHPFDIQKIHAKPGEVSVVPASATKEACLPWANDIYAKGSKRMIMPIVGFATPHYFNKLLGYEIE